MRRRGIKPGQIAAYAEVSPSVVTNWRRGAKPKTENLAKLSQRLRIDINELLRAAGHLPDDQGNGRAADPAPTDPAEAVRQLADLALTAIVRRIPIQDDWAHAGEGGENGEFVYEMPQWMGTRVLAFRIRGTCMKPLINPGDVVVAHLDGTPVDGDVVVANVGGRAEVRVLDNKGQRLTANDGSPPIPIGEVDAVVPVLGVYKAVKDVKER